MKKMFLLLAAAFAVCSVSAKVDLPEIIGSNMVLQQNATARLWGWAEPRASVKVETSWGAKTTVRSRDDGRWLAEIQTPAGGYEPQQIAITSGEKVVLGNVLIGEVWFAGGQSNMEMELNGFWNCPIEGANDIIARAGAMRDRIHYVKIPKTASMSPQERVGGAWKEFSSVTAPWCTAAGYFFAEMLNGALDVPVGLIDCTWGGSRVEGWLDRKTLESYSDPAEELTEEAFARLPDECLRPLVMYNGMIHPVTDYTIRGYIWYQGESNVGGHAWYAQRLADMVALWRGLWGEGDIPFYYVEIAPFEYGRGDMAARLREAQCRAQTLIPNSGMISTNDLAEAYEAPNIHPKNKRDVGYRLAYQALNKTYGMSDVACECPQYRSMEVRGSKIYLSLAHAEVGYDRLVGIEGFEICGPDRVFRTADVAVGPAPAFELIISAPEVTEPVAVRYAFKDFQPGNLHNTRGLPVVPFRTDDFPYRQ